MNTGVELALQVRPIDIIAGDDQGFELLPLLGNLKEFSGSEIMAADLVLGVALPMARVVAEIPVAASMARLKQGTDQLAAAVAAAKAAVKT